MGELVGLGMLVFFVVAVLRERWVAAGIDADVAQATEEWIEYLRAECPSLAR